MGSVAVAVSGGASGVAAGEGPASNPIPGLPPSAPTLADTLPPRASAEKIMGAPGAGGGCAENGNGGVKGQGSAGARKQVANKQQASALLPADRKESISIVFVGHVDAGKSTICGQILYLTGTFAPAHPFPTRAAPLPLAILPVRLVLYGNGRHVNENPSYPCRVAVCYFWLVMANAGLCSELL